MVERFINYQVQWRDRICGAHLEAWQFVRVYGIGKWQYGWGEFICSNIIIFLCHSEEIEDWLQSAIPLENFIPDTKILTWELLSILCASWPYGLVIHAVHLISTTVDTDCMSRCPDWDSLGPLIDSLYIDYKERNTLAVLAQHKKATFLVPGC